MEIDWRQGSFEALEAIVAAFRDQVIMVAEANGVPVTPKTILEAAVCVLGSTTNVWLSSEGAGEP